MIRITPVGKPTRSDLFIAHITGIYCSNHCSDQPQPLVYIFSEINSKKIKMQQCKVMTMLDGGDRPDAAE
jgi:hypothetical protein